MRLILAFFYLASLLACSSQDKREGDYTLLLDWLPNPNHVPLFVAVEKGFFRKHKVPLKILRLRDSSDGLPSLHSGRADFMLYYMPQAIHAASRDIPFKVTATLIPEPLQVFLFRSDSFILEPQDMDGRILGSSMGFFTRRLLEVLGEKHHVQFKKARAVYFDTASLLGLQAVDIVSNAYWNIEPHQMLAFGLETNYFHLKDFGVPHYHELVILGSSELEKEDKGIHKRFRKALEEAIQYCKEEPKDAFTIYLKANPSKPASQSRWEWDSWQETLPLFSEKTHPDRKVWNDFHQWMYREHFLEKEVDLDTFFGV